MRLRLKENQSREVEEAEIEDIGEVDEVEKVDELQLRRRLRRCIIFQ